LGTPELENLPIPDCGAGYTGSSQDRASQGCAGGMAVPLAGVATHRRKASPVAQPPKCPATATEPGHCSPTPWEHARDRYAGMPASPASERCHANFRSGHRGGTMALVRAPRFTGLVTLDSVSRAVVVVPFDPDEMWGAKAFHLVAGTIEPTREAPCNRRLRGSITPCRRCEQPCQQVLAALI
jgi:hypothetical protein